MSYGSVQAPGDEQRRDVAAAIHAKALALPVLNRSDHGLERGTDRAVNFTAGRTGGLA